MKKVSICIPWRDRAWVAPATLASIEAQTYPKEFLSINFIAHNCTDGTFDILHAWILKNIDKYRYCELVPVKDSTRPDGRHSLIRDRTEKDPRHAQATLKNMLVGMCDENEYWFFCDSDGILHPRCIEYLVQADKDIVGGLINVTPEESMWNFFPLQEPGAPFKGVEGRKNPPDVLSKVGFICGILLYSPMAKAACRFSFDNIPGCGKSIGEDEGAIRDAERHGIEIWMEPKARGLHVMSPEMLAPMKARWEEWLKS